MRVKNDVRQPTLLFLAKQTEECEDLIIYLLRNALNLQSTRYLVLVEILNWLTFVDENKILYKTTARIIYRLFASANLDKERQRLYHYLNKWSRDSQSAIDILNLINRSF